MGTLFPKKIYHKEKDRNINYVIETVGRSSIFTGLINELSEHLNR